MNKKDFLNGSLNPANAFRCINEKIKFRKEHPEYFEASGLLTFCRRSRTWKNYINGKLCKATCEVLPKTCYCF